MTLLRELLMFAIYFSCPVMLVTVASFIATILSMISCAIFMLFKAKLFSE